MSLGPINGLFRTLSGAGAGLYFDKDESFTRRVDGYKVDFSMAALEPACDDGVAEFEEVVGGAVFGEAA